MNLRPKTKRRLLALSVGGLVTGAAASVLVYVQLTREENRQRTLRTEGLEAYQRGDYRAAVNNFSRYLGSGQVDAETLYAYAVSRSKIPSLDLSNLRAAKSLFNQYLELKPGDPAAEHQLLQIYQQMSYNAETNGLASLLLSSNPNDVPALAAKLKVLIDQGKYSDALHVSQRIDELSPMDLQTQETTYSLMTRCDRPASELIARADQMVSMHPGDARFELLRADASSFTGDTDGARQWLVSASTRNISDPQTRQMVSFALDRLGMWENARVLIQKSAAAPSPPAATTAAWVLRLWEAGQNDQATACLKSVAISDAHADPGLLGLKAMLLFAANPADQPINPDALTALDTLAQSDDPIASCWSSLLHADYVEGIANPLQAIERCEDACRQDPANPVARFDLGRAYLRIGEGAMALKCLRQSTELAPSWSTPLVVIARTRLESDRGDLAMLPAQGAFDRDPTSPAAQTTLAIATDARLTLKSTPDEIAAALKIVRPIHEAYPEDVRVLGAYADLLARSAAPQEAIDLISAQLASPVTTSESLARLVDVCQAAHLDLNTAIADRAVLLPITTPAQLSEHVHIFIAAARPLDARRAIAAGSVHDAPDWKLAVLQGREWVGDPGLADEWIQLADSNPADLSIQHAAINSPIARARRDLIDRVIVRCKDLTGNYAVEWRLARARWQLESTDDVRNNANSVAGLMAEVVQVVPQMIEPQLLWAQALERLGDYDAAIGRLRSALAISPGDPAITVNLARLLATQGRYRAAGDLLDSVATSDALSISDRDQAVRILLQAGEPAKAISLLKNTPGSRTTDQDLLLARMYADQGDDDRAARIYKDLLRVPAPSNTVLRADSWFEASRGNLTAARALLDRLDTSQAVDGEIQIINADFEADFGTAQSAMAAYQAATEEAPSNPQTWIALGEFNLRSRDFTAAVNSAQGGLKWSPADPTLGALKMRAGSLAQLTPDENLQPLIEILAIDPSDAPATALLNQLLASQTAGETTDQVIQRLTNFASENPRFLPAQLILASRYASAGLYDDAAQTATHACEAWPAVAQAAKLLAQIQMTANHWDQALQAATEWRKRSLSHPQPADNCIAAALEHLGRPQQAETTLAMYLPRAQPQVSSAPDMASEDSTTVSQFARAVALENRFNDLQTTLQPLAKQSAVWRGKWLQILADTAPDSATATAEFARVEVLIPAGSAEDRISLADALQTAGGRFDDRALLHRALDVLDPLTDAGASPVDVLLLLGSAHQQLNQYAEAEAEYRKAMLLSPNIAETKNNLAMVILLQNEDARQARQLAAQAVTTEPGNSAMHCTLAQAQVRTGDLDLAQAQFQAAIRLDPANAEALVGLADLQSRTDLAQASETLRQIDIVLPTIRKPLSPSAQQTLDRVRLACRKTSVATPVG